MRITEEIQSVPLLRVVYEVISVPLSILFILNSKGIHPAYRMTFFKKINLGWRMFLNNRRIPTGTSYKVHLAMALKILETPPEVLGDIAECGTWKGGCAANLSLVCEIVGRQLYIFDSFQGLPEGKPHDREAQYYKTGDYAGTLAEVKENIRKYGNLNSCQFVQGWFNDTLPKVQDSFLLIFLDVDLEDSLHSCMLYLWPHLVQGGWIFTDECAQINYVALFFSERWWSTYFQTKPPGLIGAGTGLPLGQYYVGPWSERPRHPYQWASSGAYTQKGMSGYWAYTPAGESGS